jgi:hypothetical protein
MSTKRIGIELLQNRLASGDVPADLRGRYAKPVIAELLNRVYSDILNEDSYKKKDISVVATLSRQGTSGAYYITIPKRLMQGSTSITWVESCGNWHPLRNGKTENKVLNIIQPQTEDITCYLSGETLYFNGTPGESIELTYVPNVREMEDEDVLYMTGAETTVFNMVVDLIRKTDTRPEEVLGENQVEDQSYKPRPVNG